MQVFTQDKETLDTVLRHWRVISSYVPFPKCNEKLCDTAVTINGFHQFSNIWVFPQADVLKGNEMQDCGISIQDPPSRNKCNRFGLHTLLESPNMLPYQKGNKMFKESLRKKVQDNSSWKKQDKLLNSKAWKPHCNIIKKLTVATSSASGVSLPCRFYQKDLFYGSSWLSKRSKTT